MVNLGVNRRTIHSRCLQSALEMSRSSRANIGEDRCDRSPEALASSSTYDSHNHLPPSYFFWIQSESADKHDG